MPALNLNSSARRVVATLLGAVCCALAPAGASAQASIAMDTSWCSAPGLTQPFLGYGDNSWYAPAPGQSFDSFDGTGWSLSGGASLQTTTLDDGSTGQVLDLPGGSTAISPPMCVDSSYPNARAMMQPIVGTGAVFFYVSYGGGNAFQNTGQIHPQGQGWSPSGKVNTHANSQNGWQVVRFALTSTGNHNEAQLYNLFIDPYSKR